jgi:hypothetical protein
LCDIDAARLAVADEFSILRRTASFDELPRMDDIDIVASARRQLHFEQILATLGRQGSSLRSRWRSPRRDRSGDEAEKAALGRVMLIFQYRFGNGYKRRSDHRCWGDRKPYLATVETA